jgi:hypothetical protein
LARVVGLRVADAGLLVAEGLVEAGEGRFAGVEGEAPARRVDGFDAGVEEDALRVAGLLGWRVVFARVLADVAFDGADAFAGGFDAVAEDLFDAAAAGFVVRAFLDRPAVFVPRGFVAARCGLAARVDPEVRDSPDAASISSVGALTGDTDATALAAALPTPLAALPTLPPTVPAALPAADAATVAILAAMAATSWAASPA